MWKKIVLCLGIEVAAMMGATLRPEDVEDMLRASQRARIETSYEEEDRDANPRL